MFVYNQTMDSDAFLLLEFNFLYFVHSFPAYLRLPITYRPARVLYPVSGFMIGLFRGSGIDTSTWGVL